MKFLREFFFLQKIFWDYFQIFLWEFFQMIYRKFFHIFLDQNSSWASLRHSCGGSCTNFQFFLQEILRYANGKFFSTSRNSLKNSSRNISGILPAIFHISFPKVPTVLLDVLRDILSEEVFWKFFRVQLPGVALGYIPIVSRNISNSLIERTSMSTSENLSKNS